MSNYQDLNTMQQVALLQYERKYPACELASAIMFQRLDAEVKAWKSLAGYKFYMFGYWAAAWVKYNQLLPKELRDKSPFRDLVDMGKQDVDARFLRARRKEREGLE